MLAKNGKNIWQNKSLLACEELRSYLRKKDISKTIVPRMDIKKNELSDSSEKK